VNVSYTPLTYHDAQEVFANLDEIKQRHPALFLVDYVLLKISGMALCERLHAIEEFKTIPTVLVSAYAEDALRQEARRKGITVVQKPYDIDVLLSVISLQVS